MPNPTSRTRALPLWLAVLTALVLSLSSSGCKKHSGNSSAILESNIGPSSLALRGRLIFDSTPTMAHSYTGNLLSCRDCHLESGTADYAMPMIDVANLFPRYSQRAGHTITLVNRIQECFARSENGVPPPAGSPGMKALVAYIQWLSRAAPQGQPYESRGLVKLPALTGNPASGKKLYASRCAGCHGSNGAGMPPSLPPLWGAGSFSDGAGLNQTAKMAAFVQHNMPQNAPGTLSPQQSYDVAAYLATRPRPKFDKAYQNY